MTTGKIRHFFPGGNTPQGFYSFYDHIISPDASHIFILKGGPGVGKSTFMKRIGTVMQEKGYDIEFHHCSSDNNSLDGIVIPALQLALMDGTAPHIVDPKNPGCVDEIIHLGDFWNRENMAKNKEAILRCNKEIKHWFQHAYRVLQSSKAVYDNWKAINTDAINMESCYRKTNALIDEIFEKRFSTGSGKIRKLFASAITPDGSKHYIDSIVKDIPRQYIISGDPGSGKSILIEHVLQRAILLGFPVEAYYCPFEPSKVEHVIIPSLGIAVITSCFPHTYENVKANTINMDDCINKAAVLPYTQEIQFTRNIYIELFDKAVSYIHNASQLHDQLETYYIPNMDFSGVEAIWNKTLTRIYHYAGLK